LRTRRNIPSYDPRNKRSSYNVMMNWNDSTNYKTLSSIAADGPGIDWDYLAAITDDDPVIDLNPQAPYY